jgi:Mg2+ and Co2+ transporter CorA
MNTKVLHLNARRDGLVTHRIATLTFRDGEVMKGISVLGMIFLPGTFVSVGVTWLMIRYATSTNTVIVGYL